MNRLLFSALLLFAPIAASAQDDAIPLVVPPIPAHNQPTTEKPGVEERAKLNTEWMFNNIPALESSRTACLIELNRAFLDSFILAETYEADARLKLQQKAIHTRDEALKACLGDASFKILEELREKNNYKPGIAPKASAASAPASAAPAKAPNTKKSKTPAVKTPPTEVVAPTEISDRLEGEGQP